LTTTFDSRRLLTSTVQNGELIHKDFTLVKMQHYHKISELSFCQNVWYLLAHYN